MPLTGLVEKNNSLVWWQNVEAPSAFLAFSSFGFFFFNLEIDMSNKANLQVEYYHLQKLVRDYIECNEVSFVNVKQAAKYIRVK